MNTIQSKSSLETLKDCPYKYGQVYLLGKRGEPSQAAQAGTLVHKRLEVWRETGVEPDKSEVWEEYKIGEIALAMMAELPPYGTEGIATEQDETFTIDGYEYRAIKDWTTEDILGDYKTTSDISRKHVLTEETLRQDIQANLSARHMDRDLTLWWTYGQTKGKVKAKSVKLKVLKHEVRAQFHDIVEPLTVRALEILDQNKPEALSHLKNKSSCFKYGKCHLYETCWGTPEKVMKFYMTGSSLLAKLNEMKNGGSSPAVIQAATVAAAALSASADKDESQRTETDPVNPPVLRIAPPPEPELVKKPRGRPKKTTEEKEVEMPMKREAPDMTKPIRVLYCDCMPLSSNVVHAHTLIAKAADTVCNDLQVPNVKLIDYKSGGCLSAQLEADIRSMEPGFDLALITRSPEGRDVYQTLMSLAQTIVVGL